MATVHFLISAKVFLAKATDSEKRVVFKLTSKRRKVLNKEDMFYTNATTSCFPTNTAKRTRLRFNFAALSEEGQTHTNLKHKNIVQVLKLYFGIATKRNGVSRQERAVSIE